MTSRVWAIFCSSLSFCDDPGDISSGLCAGGRAPLEMPDAADACARPSLCTFPFEYNNKLYDHCTMDSQPGRFWCGLVLDVDACMSEHLGALGAPNIRYREGELCNRAGWLWLNQYVATAAQCAKLVLENLQCSPDAFSWAGKPGLDGNCGCFQQN